MNCPEFSVIIPTYNNGPEIEDAVLSVLRQDEFALPGRTFEIIIINDVSKPSHLPLLEKLAADYPQVTLLHLEKRSGPAVARNTGIKASTGKFIGFLDADDQWPADKISLLLPCFNDEQIEVVGGKVKYVIKEGIDYPDLNYEDKEGQRMTHVHLGTLLLRRTLFEKGFYFDESLIYSEDMDWWLRLRENNIRFIFTEHTTLLYHIHGSNMSVNKGPKELQLLQMLHNSLKRRRSSNNTSPIPQLKDFRVNQDDPLITIILPLNNDRLAIEKALKSILSQGYTNREILVINEGSNDEMDEYISAHIPSAKIIRQIDPNPASALNAGIAAASGDVISFIYPGDEWHPDKLAGQWAILKQNPYVNAVTCNEFIIDKLIIQIPGKERQPKEERFSAIAGGVMVRKPVLISMGSLDKITSINSKMDLLNILQEQGVATRHLELSA